MSICYQTPDLPLTVIVKFDNYHGPSLPDNTVPVVPIHHTWTTSGCHCSCLQLPLKLVWAVLVFLMIFQCFSKFFNSWQWCHFGSKQNLLAFHFNSFNIWSSGQDTLFPILSSLTLKLLRSANSGTRIIYMPFKIVRFSFHQIVLQYHSFARFSDLLKGWVKRYQPHCLLSITKSLIKVLHHSVLVTHLNRWQFTHNYSSWVHMDSDYANVSTPVKPIILWNMSLICNHVTKMVAIVWELLMQLQGYTD